MKLAQPDPPKFPYVCLSENSGTPKSSIFNRVFHYKPSILGYPYGIFGNTHMFVGFLGLDFFKEILLPFYHEIHHDCSPPFGRISRWWFQQFSMFTPKIGEDEPIFDVYVFFSRWVGSTTNQNMLFLYSSILSKSNRLRYARTAATFLLNHVPIWSDDWLAMSPMMIYIRNPGKTK